MEGEAKISFHLGRLIDGACAVGSHGEREHHGCQRKLEPGSLDDLTLKLSSLAHDPSANHRIGHGTSHIDVNLHASTY